jgi:hypothetical protein
MNNENTNINRKLNSGWVGYAMKLDNARSTGWLHNEYAMIQDRALFVGVHIECENNENNDRVVLLFKDMGKWELNTNRSEDAFHFLYRYVERHSKRMYGQQGDPFYKEFIIISFNACLTLPVRPEYLIRDVEAENNRGKNKGGSKYSTFLKIRNWLDHLPVCGTSKRIFLETHVDGNFPVQMQTSRNTEKEKIFAVQAFKKIIEWKEQSVNIKGWDEGNLDYKCYRDAFFSMLVSMAYARWKSKDKSGGNDFLQLIADHDGTYWLLDFEDLMKE